MNTQRVSQTSDGGKSNHRPIQFYRVTYIPVGFDWKYRKQGQRHTSRSSVKALEKGQGRQFAPTAVPTRPFSVGSDKDFSLISGASRERTAWAATGVAISYTMPTTTRETEIQQAVKQPESVEVADAQR